LWLTKILFWYHAEQIAYKKSGFEGSMECELEGTRIIK
jgi:hypothetical protein